MTRLLVVATLLAAVLLGLLVTLLLADPVTAELATPSETHDPAASLAVRESRGASQPTDRETAINRTHRLGAPQPSGSGGTLIYSASATWCAPTPTHCQGWGGNARLAAVNSFRFGDEPYWVRVWRGDAFADAVVVSFCACMNRTDRIDLSPAAFLLLAPLALGRIDVEVEVLDWPAGGDPPPHPDDQRMRAEDQLTPPPTDQED